MACTSGWKESKHSYGCIVYIVRSCVRVRTLPSGVMPSIPHTLSNNTLRTMPRPMSIGLPEERCCSSTSRRCKDSVVCNNGSKRRLSNFPFPVAQSLYLPTSPPPFFFLSLSFFFLTIYIYFIILVIYQKLLPDSQELLSFFIITHHAWR